MCAVEIRELSLESDDDLRLYYDVNQASSVPELRDFTAESFTSFKVNAQPTAAWARRNWAAFRDGTPVGVACLRWPLLANLTTAWLFASVHADHQGQGVASALLRVVEEAVPEGRTQLNGYGLVPPGVELEESKAARTGRRNGYHVASVETLSSMPLGPDADAKWAALQPQADASSSGYTVRTYVNGIPEAQREQYGILCGLVDVDAPTGELECEPSPLSPERYATNLATALTADKTWIETIATCDDTCEVVALSQLIVEPEADVPVDQGNTYVHREHRGHRLGLAVKLANARRLRELFPDRTSVITYSSSQNDAMQHINRQMGFQQVATELILTKTVA